MTQKASLIRDAFLFCLSRTGNMTISADCAGVRRAEISAWMACDDGFVKAVDAAMSEAYERVFYEAMQRGLSGVESNRYYKSEVIGTVRTPSDGLLRYVLDQLAVQCELLGAGMPEEDTDDIAALRERIKRQLAVIVSNHEETNS